MLKIADIKIECGKLALKNSKRLSSFRHFGFSSQLRSEIQWAEKVERPLDALLILNDQWSWDGEEESLEWYKSLEGFILIFVKNKKVVGRMALSRRYEVANIVFNGHYSSSGYSIPESLLSVQFRNYIYSKRGCILHSSAIAVGGEALLFTAASGTGKSTHTSLWEKERGAVVFNDDTPAIRLFEDAVYAYGTPWSGSSQKYKNMKLPLKGIVILERGAVNEMSRLTPGEAAFSIMPRFMLPYQDESLMVMAMATVDELIKKVPIYRLSCTPDIRAVEAVEKALAFKE